MPAQWLSPYSLPSVSVSDNIGLGLSSISFDFTSSTWRYNWTSSRVGSAVVTWGPHCQPHRHDPDNLQSQPHLVWAAPRSTSPDGAELWIANIYAIASESLRSVQLTIKDPKVALLHAQASIDWTASVSQSLQTSGLWLKATGKPGQSTVLTVSAPGVDPFDIPLRVVRTALVPDAQDYYFPDGKGPGCTTASGRWTRIPDCRRPLEPTYTPPLLRR